MLPLPRSTIKTQTSRSTRYRLTGAWPSADHDQILAVAHHDLDVARQNIAELTLYVDDHAAHLAACAGAKDVSVPLMSAETFPRLAGGIRAALQDTD